MHILDKLKGALRLPNIIAVIFLFLITFSSLQIFFPYNLSSTIIIPKGAGYSEITNMLYDSKICKNKIYPYTIFLAAKILGKSPKYGEYEIKGRYSIYDVTSKILNGEVMMRYITIPEGYSNYQIISLVSSNEKLVGDINVKFKEGDLLPETYDYTYGDTRNSIIYKMLKAKKDFINNYNISDDNYITIMASIIQKEAANDGEMPLVASVFANRMKLGMPLQADPTVIYAITKGKDLGRNLTKKDLQIDSPYNTYLYKGLPHGAICNPGKKAMLAAASPAKTNYLYFVVSPEGKFHNFSSNLKSHNNNVRNYRKINKSS